jgi:hypothetical protein
MIKILYGGSSQTSETFPKMSLPSLSLCDRNLNRVFAEQVSRALVDEDGLAFPYTEVKENSVVDSGTVGVPGGVVIIIIIIKQVEKKIVCRSED